MTRSGNKTVVALAMFSVCGCSREERGPMLAGGREVKSWLAALHDPKPQVRRQAVLKLGNVGDADPTAAEGLAEALRDTDALIRSDAIYAVAKLTKPGKTILAQLKVMSDSDRDTRVRDNAKKALKHFGAAE
jgi:HEAT repeat protein